MTSYFLILDDLKLGQREGKWFANDHGLSEVPPLETTSHPRFLLVTTVRES